MVLVGVCIYRYVVFGFLGVGCRGGFVLRVGGCGW